MNKSVFAADLHVYGDVSSKGDLDVHGHVEGTVNVGELGVARDAAIDGHVRAVSATVAGAIVGGLDSDRVAIESTGRVEGDVTYRTLSMLVGGVLNARCVPARTESVPAGLDPEPAARTARTRAQRESASPARATSAPVSAST